MIVLLNPGSWEAIYPQLAHVSWDGLTFADIVFPLFLFILGVAIPYSLSKAKEYGPHILLGKIFRRSIILFGLGFILSALSFTGLSALRIMGVLQRIAICYLLASLMFLRFSWRQILCWIVVLLVGYSSLMMLVLVPGYGFGVLTPEGNLAGYVDRLILGTHTWASWGDPEGLLSTLGALATTLMGVVCGIFIRKNPHRRPTWMLLSGLCLIICGWIVSFWLPINKQLWSSSFVLVTGGIALLVLAMCLVMDGALVLRPFQWLGLNPLAIYFASSVIGFILWKIPVRESNLVSWNHSHVFSLLGGPVLGSLLYALTYALVWTLISYVLHRKKIYIRI
ncbi:MAG TPA: DUF5009 domain-containing protein [Candidatus Nanoarchaeia archaeon]|nr:DUF5009 domain-containing protein [Candidatus Nanoarchaeia archaeon]